VVRRRGNRGGLAAASGTRIRLTRRERQILELLLEGRANKEIAARLRVSAQTVKNQLTTLYRKARVDSRLALVAAAHREAWLTDAD
jgi:DNA-binding NarL/FixJ family response regulator